MKRTISVILALLFMLTLAACGGGVARWTADEGHFDGVPAYAGEGETGAFNPTDDMLGTVVTISGVSADDHAAYIKLLEDDGYAFVDERSSSVLYWKDSIYMLVTYANQTMVLLATLG